MSINTGCVTIIIPNLNGEKILKTCLDSLNRQTFRDFSVIMIDNGSSDGSVEFVRRGYANVRIIEFKENMGFSAAVNKGIKRSRSKYVCLLNNDTALAPDFLKEVITFLETREDIDYCASKMLNFSNREVLDGAGDGVIRCGVGYKIGNQEHDQRAYDDSKEVFGACAGAAIYRRSFFERIGYFDEDFFAYLEDVDINFRAKLFGLKCWYVSSARVFHVGSSTTGSAFNSFIVRSTTRNMLNVVVKNIPFGIFVKSFPVVLLYHLYWLFVVLNKREFFAYLEGVSTAFRDFPGMMIKRKEVLLKKVISNSEFWLSILDSEKEVMESVMRRRRETGRSTFLVELYMKLFLRNYLKNGKIKL